jgi:hypothetical protein
MRHRRSLAWLVALAIAFVLACESPGAPPPDPSKPWPDAPAKVEPLKQSGVRWTNAEIRAHYLRLVAAIGPADAQWRREGLAALERARRAFQMRHDARLTCRAMMSDRREVEALEQRDREKYGHPDGPTFDELIEHQRKKGLSGDAVFEAIVASAQRTDRAVDEVLLGPRGNP